MRRSLVAALCCLALSLACSAAAWAGKLNAADYPLRVHIFGLSGHAQYYYGSLMHTDGSGRANLYENSTPTAFDFNFRCGFRLMTSIGFETYMARWKKPGSTMELLVPEVGHADKADLCELEVTMKPGEAYLKHNGIIGEESASMFKEWMVKHQYDPEHGLNEPIRTAEQPAGAPPATPPAQQQQ